LENVDKRNKISDRIGVPTEKMVGKHAQTFGVKKKSFLHSTVSKM
jgi:hypothetical protein